MSWTKRQLVHLAYAKIGYGVNIDDLDPAQLEIGLRLLDAQMATWDEEGIRVGYPLSPDPEDADLDTETNMPAMTNKAVYLNLACELAPTIGKEAQRSVMVAAQKAYNTLLHKNVKPREMSYPEYLPAGAGNKQWRGNRSPFIQQDDNELDIGEDGALDV